MTWAIRSQESDFLGSTIWNGECHDQNSVKEISGHASSGLKVRGRESLDREIGDLESSDPKAKGREGSDHETPAGQEISNQAKATDHENSSKAKENGTTTIEIGVLSLKGVDLQGNTEAIGRGRESTGRIGGCKDHVAADTKGTPQVSPTLLSHSSGSILLSSQFVTLKL
jgi:hypothetical protein